MANENIIKTPLYALHQELGGRMVAFAGYHLPIQYIGAIAEHTHCRNAASLFDISHMGQCYVRVTPVQLESVQTASLENLAIGHTKYALFTNKNGGILDDLMITRTGDEEFFLVVNGACKADDFALLATAFGKDKVEILTDYALIAVQGPQAEKVLASFAPAVSGMAFMESVVINIENKKCRVSRLGYTGEDGFEISAHQDDIAGVSRALLGHDLLMPAGLGARDSLRLEAGLCLYGHDIHQETTPIEAGLSFAVGKKRSMPACFPGAEIIFTQMQQGTVHIRVGFAITGKIPIRESTEIFDKEHIVGKVTSGGYSPTLQKPIAMGYMMNEALRTKNNFVAKVRGKEIAVTICNPAFFANRFKR